VRLWKQTKEYLDNEKKIPNPEYKKLVWWCDFTVDGKRYRFSTDTTNKNDATKLAKKKEAQASEGKLSASSESFARLTFSEAADKYLISRKLELQASSLAKEKQLTVKLKEYFGFTRLNRITSENILAYREQRGAGPSIINMEVGLLRRVMKRGKCWAIVAEDIKPLKEPQTIGRALTTVQKTRLIETAATRPEWETAYLASVIALATTMRGCEVKRLRWQDVELSGDPATLTIHKSKTSAGERTLPLTREAGEAFIKLRARSQTFGPVEPEHFIFARFRFVARFDGRQIVERRVMEFDPTQPVKSWKKAWRKLTIKAGLPGLRFHDCRHSAITALLTNPSVSIQTAKSIAGHIDQRMIDRYAHIHLDAKRNAVEIALSTPPQDGTAIDSPDLPM
jgi:integrase